MLTSDFLKISGSLPKFPGEENSRFAPSVDAHESSPPNLFGKQSVLEKFQMIWQPYPTTTLPFIAWRIYRAKAGLRN